MKELLLTGATGMVGGAVGRYFAEQGWTITAAVPETEIDQVVVGSAVPFDLNEEGLGQELEEAMQRADAVIHAGAVLPNHIDETVPSQRDYLFKSNVLGTAGLLNLARQHGVDQFIQIGTTHEEKAELPSNYYKFSKWVMEGLVPCTLRISAPYGMGNKAQSVIPVMLGKALAGEEIELWGDGSREQVFTHVDDVALACLLAVEREARGVFTITGPKAVTMKELAETIVQIVSKAGVQIVYAGRDDPNQAVSRAALTYAKAEQEFGYRPQVSLRDGLTSLVESQQQIVKQ